MVVSCFCPFFSNVVLVRFSFWLFFSLSVGGLLARLLRSFAPLVFVIVVPEAVRVSDITRGAQAGDMAHLDGPLLLPLLLPLKVLPLQSESQ